MRSLTRYRIEDAISSRGRGERALFLRI